MSDWVATLYGLLEQANTLDPVLAGRLWAQVGDAAGAVPNRAVVTVRLSDGDPVELDVPLRSRESFAADVLTAFRDAMAEREVASDGTDAEAWTDEGSPEL